MNTLYLLQLLQPTKAARLAVKKVVRKKTKDLSTDYDLFG